MQPALQEQPHTSVMLQEVLEYLAPVAGETYVDGTFGAGGYSRAILESANCNLYGIDRDPDVQTFADDLSAQFPTKFSFLQGRFSEMEALLKEKGITQVDGIVLDVGVSSMQIDQAERGFSFQRDGALDMRMGQGGMDASRLVNELGEKQLADIIYQLGGERKSRHIARAIVEERKKAPITRTLQLAKIIEGVVRRAKDGLHPATRTFQALRIYVNDELGELQKALESAERLLKKGGRLVIVSFHSLEDGLVKQFLREQSSGNQPISRYLPDAMEQKVVIFELLTRKAVMPNDKEIRENIRARSAKLRAAKKC